MGFLLYQEESCLFKLSNTVYIIKLKTEGGEFFFFYNVAGRQLLVANG